MTNRPKDILGEVKKERERQRDKRLTDRRTFRDRDRQDNQADRLTGERHLWEVEKERETNRQIHRKVRETGIKSERYRGTNRKINS